MEIYKIISRYSKYEFEKNIPSKNQIDRLQIVNYPLGGGELRNHMSIQDKNQRVVSGLIMSKKRYDFNSGFYFRDKNNKKLNIEDNLELGDPVIFYGSIVHGVEVVDKNKSLDWKSYKGRWFVGMFVNDSDHVKNRNKDLTNSTNFKKRLARVKKQILNANHQIKKYHQDLVFNYSEYPTKDHWKFEFKK